MLTFSYKLFKKKTKLKLQDRYNKHDTKTRKPNPSLSMLGGLDPAQPCLKGVDPLSPAREHPQSPVSFRLGY